MSTTVERQKLWRGRRAFRALIFVTVWVIVAGTIAYLIRPVEREPLDSVVRQFVEHGIVQDGRIYRFRLLTPPELVPGKSYPVLVFLHGAGEKGSDNRRQLNGLPAQMAESPWRERFPCFLIVPQCPEGARWPDAALTQVVLSRKGSYEVSTGHSYITAATVPS